MTQTSVTIQVNPQSVPSTPPWMGEVAAVAQVLTHGGLLKAIEEHVQFARARFGQYDTIDARGRASGLCAQWRTDP